MISDPHAHFAAGRKAVNGWYAIPSAATAEILGRQGFDLMTVDLQHVFIGHQSVFITLQVQPARYYSGWR